MPQSDFSTYFSQMFWLALSFLPIYLVLKQFFIPKFNNLIIRRNFETVDLEQQTKSIIAEIKKIESEIEFRIKDTSNQIKRAREAYVAEIDSLVNSKIKEIDDEISISRSKFKSELDAFYKNSANMVDMSVVNYSVALANKVSSEKVDVDLLKNMYKNLSREYV